MNIFQKISTYFTILRLSKSHSKAKYAFAGRFVESDYYLIVLTIAIIALVTVLAFKTEIDGITSASAESVARARQIANNAKAQELKNEAIIISMLNGRVKRDGSVKTVCILKASGDCE
jgi:translation elongation factor EF-Ts